MTFSRKRHTFFPNLSCLHRRQLNLPFHEVQWHNLHKDWVVISCLFKIFRLVFFVRKEKTTFRLLCNLKSTRFEWPNVKKARREMTHFLFRCQFFWSEKNIVLITMTLIVLSYYLVFIITVPNCTVIITVPIIVVVISLEYWRTSWIWILNTSM